MKMSSLTGKRGKIDETLAAMFSNPTYREDYLFYAHIIGQCSIKIRQTLPAPAAIAFRVDHYELYINPFSTTVPYEEIKDKLREGHEKALEYNTKVGEDGTLLWFLQKGFDEYTLEERLAILKHEMQHLLLGHCTLGRLGEYDNTFTAVSARQKIKERLDALGEDAIKQISSMKFADVKEMLIYLEQNKDSLNVPEESENTDCETE